MFDISAYKWFPSVCPLDFPEGYGRIMKEPKHV